MRIIDCYVRPEEADRVVEAARGSELRAVVSDAGELRHVRVAIPKGSPDAFLEKITDAVHFDDADETFYVVSEPLAIRPVEEEEASDKGEGEREAARDEIEALAEQGGVIGRSFLVLSAAAAVLATGGLIIENIPVVVGAMVIAPVFKPIVAVTAGITLGRGRFIGRGLLCLAITLGMAIVFGALITLATPLVEINQALAARSDLNLFALIVALAAGAAAGYTVIQNDRITMIGIVVAASLVPAACALGVGLGLMDVALMIGSASTLASNLLGISLAMLLVMRIEQLRADRGLERSKAKRLSTQSIWLGTGATVALAIVFGVVFFVNYGAQQDRAAARRLFERPDAYPQGVIAWDYDRSMNTGFVYTRGAPSESLVGQLRSRFTLGGGSGPVVPIVLVHATPLGP